MASIDPQLLKGFVALIVLRLIDERSDYGYALVVRLREAGFDEIAEGTVYPALTRCERVGWLEGYLVASDKGPARKYYRLTSAGRDEYARLRLAWDQLDGLMTGLLKGVNR